LRSSPSGGRFIVNSGRSPLPDAYVAHLEQFVATDRRGDAVEYFMTEDVGLPRDFVAPMRELPFWPSLEAAAHTLAYDGRISEPTMAGTAPSPADWSSVRPRRSCSTEPPRGG
jgi:hypothetical protein